MEVFLDLSARGQTIFMVTHNPENAALAHRTLHIRDGRPSGGGWLAAPGAPAEEDLLAAARG